MRLKPFSIASLGEFMSSNSSEILDLLEKVAALAMKEAPDGRRIGNTLNEVLDRVRNDARLYECEKTALDLQIDANHAKASEDFKNVARRASALMAKVRNLVGADALRRSREGPAPRSVSASGTSQPRTWPDVPPDGEAPPPQVAGDHTLQGGDDSVPIQMIERPPRPSEIETEPLPSPDGDGHTEKMPLPPEHDAITTPLGGDRLTAEAQWYDDDSAVSDATFITDVRGSTSARTLTVLKALGQAGAVVGILLLLISSVLYAATKWNGEGNSTSTVAVPSLAEVQSGVPDVAILVQEPTNELRSDAEAPESTTEPGADEPVPEPVPTSPPEPTFVQIDDFVDCTAPSVRLTPNAAVFTRQFEGQRYWAYAVEATLRPGEVNGRTGVCIYADGPNAGQPLDLACLLQDKDGCPAVNRM